MRIRFWSISCGLLLSLLVPLAYANPSCLSALTSGAKFLSNKLDGLQDTPEVQRAARQYEQDHQVQLTSATERIAAWLKVIEQVIETHDPKAIDEIRNTLFKTYLVKSEDIPESYYQRQVQLARQRGESVQLDESKKKQLAQQLIEDQKQSLNSWISYLLEDPNTPSSYPAWLRYWALIEMAQLGQYNPTKGSYSGRPPGTVAPFAELNREAFSLVVEIALAHVNKKTLDQAQDPKLLEYAKRMKFGNLYGRALQMNLPDEEVLKITEGSWRKFAQGSDNMKLVDSLRGRATGWCTAGEATAQTQLEAGDFYVYYSNDRSGRPSIPRLAIRMQGSSIAETRGVAKDQNLDPAIARTDVLEDKLKQFGAEGQKYRKRSRDMKLLTVIEQKHEEGLPLALDEVGFLYEIKDSIEGFGYEKDPRISEIIQARGTSDFEALAKILGFEPHEITLNKADVLSGKGKVFVGDLLIDESDDMSKSQLIIVTGSLTISTTKVKGLSKLVRIGGAADFGNLTRVVGLESLIHIGGDARFNSLRSAVGLEALVRIGGDAWFNSLTSAEGLEALAHIGGDAWFNRLRSAVGLEALVHIGGEKYFPHIPEEQRPPFK